MGDHKRSLRFKGDGFNIEILEEGDRQYIETMEEYWINKLDSYHNGLNETACGKGSGHNAPRFTTLGYLYSDESRKKMSVSAKLRAAKEGFEARSNRSKANYENPEYLKKQQDSKRGKRLRPPKISDETVALMREHFEREKIHCIEEIKEYNSNAIKRGWSQKTPESHFASKYAETYNCSNVAIKGIILWKTRTKILPSLHGNM